MQRPSILPFLLWGAFAGCGGRTDFPLEGPPPSYEQTAVVDAGAALEADAPQQLIAAPASPPPSNDGGLGTATPCTKSCDDGQTCVFVPAVGCSGFEMCVTLRASCPNDTGYRFCNCDPQAPATIEGVCAIDGAIYTRTPAQDCTN